MKSNIFLYIITLLVSVVFSMDGLAAPAGPSIDDSKPVPRQAAMNLQGSHWELTYHIPKAGEVKYVISFFEGGKMRHTHPYDKTIGNDRWYQNGKNITIIFEGGYSTYKGRMIAKDTIQGTARNVRGQTWTWSASKLNR